MKKKTKQRIAIISGLVLCGCWCAIYFMEKHKDDYAAKTITQKEKEKGKEEKIQNDELQYKKLAFKKVELIKNISEKKNNEKNNEKDNERNNAELYFLPLQNNNNIVYVKYVFKNTGVFHNEINKHGISSIVSSILFKRINGLFPEETLEKLRDLGIRDLVTSSHQDDFEISFYVDQKNVKNVLEFLNIAFTNPNFSEGDLELCKESVPTVLNPETTSPDLLMLRKLFELLYENSNYGLNPVGTSQAISGITVDEVKEFIKEKLTTNNVKVFVVGDISENDAKDFFETTFKNIPQGSSNESIKISDAKISELKKTEVQKENMNDIVGITIGSRIDSLSEKEKAALQIANELIFDNRYSDFKEGLKLDAKIACNFYTKYVRRTLSNAFVLVAYVNKKDLDGYLKYWNAKTENYKRSEFWQEKSGLFLQIKNHFVKNTMKNEFLNIADIDEQMKDVYLPFDQVLLEDVVNVVNKIFAADKMRIVICHQKNEEKK